MVFPKKPNHLSKGNSTLDLRQLAFPNSSTKMCFVLYRAY